MKSKNKKTQYLLLIVVLAVWGTIAFQIFNYTQSDFKSTNSELRLPLQNVQLAKDLKFQISLDYTDPFFNNKGKKNLGASNKTKNIKSGPAKIPKKVRQQQQSKNFPKILYKGYSLNNNQIARVSISINNLSTSLKKGETKNGVLLKKTSLDSIIVSYSGFEKVIYKNK